MVCIVTGKAGCAAKGAMTRPGKATTWSSNVMTRPRGRRDTTGNALSRRLAGGECHDTKHCIVTGERDWPLRVVSRYSLYIVTGGQSGYRACHDTIGCIMTGGGLATGVCRNTPGDMTATWLRHGTQQHAHDTVEGACDTAGAGPAIRHPARHDTARHGRPGSSTRRLG